MSTFHGPVMPEYEPLKGALADFKATPGHDVLDRATKVACTSHQEFGEHRWGEFYRACKEAIG